MRAALVSPIEFAASAKDTPMRTTFSAVRTFVMAFLILAGSVAAVFAAPAQDAAASSTYGYWNTDGCYYTWGGRNRGFQRTTTCGSAQGVQWSKYEGHDVLWYYDGTTWHPQGMMVSIDGETAFGLLGTGNHLFLYFRASNAWLHTYQEPGSEVMVEGAAGWVTLTQLAESQSYGTQIQRQMAASEHVMIMGWLDMPKPCEYSVNGC